MFQFPDVNYRMRRGTCPADFEIFWSIARNNAGHQVHGPVQPTHSTSHLVDLSASEDTKRKTSSKCKSSARTRENAARGLFPVAAVLHREYIATIFVDSLDIRLGIQRERL